nr:hypothetical protein CFP56_64325 [Quercus suber]
MRRVHRGSSRTNGRKMKAAAKAVRRMHQRTLVLMEGWADKTAARQRQWRRQPEGCTEEALALMEECAEKALALMALRQRQWRRQSEGCTNEALALMEGCIDKALALMAARQRQ